MSVRTLLVALATLAGCDTVFGLERTDGGGGGPITFVQTASTTSNPFTTMICDVGLPARTGADGLLVLVVTSDSASPVGTVTDNLGSTYQLAVGPKAWEVSPFTTSLYYAANVPAQAVVTTTVTMTTPSSNMCELYLSEYGGASPTAPFDQGAITTGNGTDLTTGERALTAGTLLFGHGEGRGGVVSAGPLFDVRSEVNNNIEEDRLIPISGMYAATFTLDTANEWLALMAAFH